MRSFITFILMPVVVSACSTQAPERFYALSPSSGKPAIVSASFDRDIVVQLTGIPEMVDRPQIVVMSRNDEPVLSDSDRWADSVRHDLLHVMTVNLSASLPDAWVSETTSDRNANALRILIRVNEMQVKMNRQVELSGSWILRSGSDQVLTSGRFELRRDIRPTMQLREIVGLYSEELGDLNLMIARSIVNAGGNP